MVLIIKQHTVSKFTNFKSSSISVFRPYEKKHTQSWKQSSPIRFLSLQEIFQIAPCLQYLRSGQAQSILYLYQIHKMANNPPTSREHVWQIPSNSNAMHELWFHLHATPLGSLCISCLNYLLVSQRIHFCVLYVKFLFPVIVITFWNTTKQSS